MENGLAYHFVICNGHGGTDGLVEIGSRWQKQLDGGHLRGDELNSDSIGICLVGDFTRTPPTARQLSSLKALLVRLLQLTGLPPSAITGHKSMPGQATACPGVLPISEIIQSLPQVTH
jgi:N-acetyl-anhydromuramyl-L-alanine amidase AmpD